MTVHHNDAAFAFVKAANRTAARQARKTAARQAKGPSPLLFAAISVLMLAVFEIHLRDGNMVGMGVFAVLAVLHLILAYRTWRERGA